MFSVFIEWTGPLSALLWLSAESRSQSSGLLCWSGAFKHEFVWLNAFFSSKCGIKARPDTHGIKYTISHEFGLLRDFTRLKASSCYSIHTRQNVSLYPANAIAGWCTTTGACHIKIHQKCLKVDPVVLYYTARVIMIGTYRCHANGCMATTSRENVAEI